MKGSPQSIRKLSNIHPEAIYRKEFVIVTQCPDAANCVTLAKALYPGKKIWVELMNNLGLAWAGPPGWQAIINTDPDDLDNVVFGTGFYNPDVAIQRLERVLRRLVEKRSRQLVKVLEWIR